MFLIRFWIGPVTKGGLAERVKGEIWHFFARLGSALSLEYA
jgi:hypothetical protein